MKAVILVGGEGTRLRPLTLTTPKPVVPVVDRPFLTHQLDLLASAGVDEVVFSVAYKPERIQAVFGTGAGPIRTIHYAVEETPLGTGGAVKNAEAWLDETTIVLNGDVLTDVDLKSVVHEHRQTRAAATIVLTPVANPSAYGLVETDASGRVARFIEKPDPSQITTDMINAGIYVLDKHTLALMPPGINYSIERSFFPALLASGAHFQAYAHRGYWIDIGTPAKYLQVHQDILRGRYPVALAGQSRQGGWVDASARISETAELVAPFYVGPGCELEAGCRIGPEATLVRNVRVDEGATIQATVVWEGSQIRTGATVEGALIGPRTIVGRNVTVGPGAVLGEGSMLSDFTRTV